MVREDGTQCLFTQLIVSMEIETLQRLKLTA